MSMFVIWLQHCVYFCTSLYKKVTNYFNIFYLPVLKCKYCWREFLWKEYVDRINNYNIVESPSTTYFMYVENGRSGIMKRSGMDINVESLKETLPLYSVS